jgi:hypothetical protein
MHQIAITQPYKFYHFNTPQLQKLMLHSPHKLILIIVFRNSRITKLRNLCDYYYLDNFKRNCLF